MSLFETQLAHFEEQSELAVVESMQAALEQADAQFSAELRRRAIAELEAGRGLLVRDGEAYDEAVEGCWHLMWSGGAQLDGDDVFVLTCFKKGGGRIDQLDVSFRQTRGVYLADRLQEFNNTPRAARADEIMRFREARKKGVAHQAGKVWFGLEPHWLSYVKVDEPTLQVIPAGF
ncbi:MAG: hypothetical protein AB8H80_12060 [Planctomycetota bacterium]